MFDETTDIANVSQLSLVIRYFWKKSIYEDFVGFLDVQSEISAMNENFDNTMELKATGLNLGQIVLKKLKDMGMNLNHCVGITTDGCSVMTSDSCGAVKTVMAETKNASYCPCYNHKLNLSISQSSSVQAIRNVVGTLKDVIAFFKASAKRSHLLKNVMGHKLCGLCETRWVERHDGVIQFRDCIGKVIETLDHIATWTDMHTAAKAKSLRLSLCNGEVIISIVCLANLLNCTLQLSRYFQKTRIDMKSAQEFLVDTITILSNKRKKSEEYFANLFEEARSTAEELDVELKVPRLAGKQKNRENHSCKSVEDYYRVTIFIRLLDNIIADLKIRFPEETLQLFDFYILFPGESTVDNHEYKNALNRLVTKYASIFGESENVLHGKLCNEMELYELHCKKYKLENCDALQILDSCDEVLFPVITTLFKIFLSLPISSCSAERSFFSLRRIKTWLRSSMTEDRLDGLALMNIHWNIAISVDNVIDRFANSGKRRNEFVL
ncbi:hypothetical protein TKK_0000333 [Trichogramma kaykai]